MTPSKTNVNVGETIQITFSNPAVPQFEGFMAIAEKQDGGRNGRFTFSGAGFRDLVYYQFFFLHS